MRSNSVISGKVTGTRCFLDDLPYGGLESHPVGSDSDSLKYWKRDLVTAAGTTSHHYQSPVA